MRRLWWLRQSQGFAGSIFKNAHRNRVWVLAFNIGDALPNLQSLYLGDNYFESHIPPSVGNPKPRNRRSIYELFCWPYPKLFWKPLTLGFSKPRVKHAWSARVSGGWVFQLDALANYISLKMFSLSTNQLHGAIPNSIATVGGNRLSGIVPPSIAKLSGLVQISLGQNNPTGTINEWVYNI
jgi:Leucine-rich repeat (LRR) protein